MKEYLFSSCALENNKLYFFSNYDGIPAMLDLKQNKVSIMNFKSELTLGVEDSITQMVSFKGKIYALRNRGDALLIYDTDHNEYTEISIECNRKSWGNFIDVFVYHSKLYIFERYKKNVLIMNCSDNKFEKKLYSMADTQNFFCGYHVSDRMWLFPQQGKKIGSFNLTTNVHEEISGDFEFCDVISCTGFENEIYILDRSGSIYCWNVEDKTMSVCFTEKFLELMGGIVVTKQNIILLPSLGEEIKIYDKQNKQIRVYNQYPDGFQYEAPSKWSKWHGKCEDKNKIYLAMRSANYFLVIDKKSGELNWLKPELPLEKDRIKYLIYQKESFISEGETTLDTFIECISHQKEKVAKVQKNGERIWNLGK